MRHLSLSSATHAMPAARAIILAAIFVIYAVIETEASAASDSFLQSPHGIVGQYSDERRDTCGVSYDDSTYRMNSYIGAFTNATFAAPGSELVITVVPTKSAAAARADTHFFVGLSQSSDPDADFHMQLRHTKTTAAAGAVSIRASLPANLTCVANYCLVLVRELTGLASACLFIHTDTHMLSTLDGNNVAGEVAHNTVTHAAGAVALAIDELAGLEAQAAGVAASAAIASHGINQDLQVAGLAYDEETRQLKRMREKTAKGLKGMRLTRKQMYSLMSLAKQSAEL